MKHVSLLIGVMALATMGLGCRPPVNNRPIKTTFNDPIPQEAPVPFDPNAPLPKDNESPSAEGLMARNALQNLALAKTYRAKMTIPTSDGNIVSTIDVNRDQGLMGKMEMPNNGETLVAEIYISKDETLFRQGNTSWTNILETEEGRPLTELIQSSLASDEKNISRIVSDNTRTVEVKEDPSGCTLYTLSQVNSAGERLPYKICIKNDLPMYLTMNTDKGALRIDYSEINTSIEIKKPIK